MAGSGSARPEFFEGLVLGLTEGLLLADLEGTIRWASPAAGELVGRSAGELVGMTTMDIQHPDDAALSRARRAEQQPDGGPPIDEVWHSMRRVVWPDGSIHWLDCTSIDRTGDPAVGGVIVVLRDAGERHRAWETERRLRAIIETGEETVAVFGADLRLVYASPAAQRLMGGLADALPELLHRSVRRSHVPETAAALEQLVGQPGLVIQREVPVTFVDGSVHWLRLRAANLLHDPAVAGLVVSAEDITERIALEDDLRAAAMLDPLTGLPNRAQMVALLAAALEETDDPSEVAVLFVDLDRFKVVNDSFGHATGDRVLHELGARLAAAVGDRGTVGRFGGDEYVVVSRQVTLDDAIALADLLACTASSPFEVMGAEHEHVEVFLSGSVGIAIGEPGISPANLLHHADAAMYRAKARGRGSWELYDEGMRSAALARLTLETDLARALDDDGFELWFQPIVDVGNGTVRGFEALARWPRQGGRVIGPSEFIPVAEDTGGIHRLGAWALATACEQVAAWRDAGLGELHVSVNLSPRQLTRDDLAGEVAGLLERSDLDPSLLTLEITESLLMEDLELAVKALSRLHDVGVRLALDDFGTGWSSLTYLRVVPVDIVKIDRSFIQGVSASPEDRAIVAAVVSMCQTLGKQVVAEGVETEDQLRALRGLRCSHAQGFLFAAPLRAAEVPSWLQRFPKAGNRDPDAR